LRADGTAPNADKLGRAAIKVKWQASPKNRPSRQSGFCILPAFSFTKADAQSWHGRLRQAITALMQNSTSISLPDLHGVPVFYPHGTQLIWISQNGEITHPKSCDHRRELALGIVLLCHRRWSSARAGCRD
jgi:hypothetical protein